MAGNSSCQPIYDIGGGGRTFVLQNDQSGEYLSAVSDNPLQQISSSLNDSRLWFTYDTTTLQIKSEYNGLCIDDLRHGYSSQSSTSDTLVFNGCTDSFSQQFVYQFDTGYLVNPNNAYDKCIDGYIGYGHNIYLWYCPQGTTNHQWTIILVCPSGNVTNYSIIIASLTDFNFPLRQVQAVPYAPLRLIQLRSAPSAAAYLVRQAAIVLPPACLKAYPVPQVPCSAPLR